MKSLGLLVLRLVVGSIFALHGYSKLFGGEGKGNALSDSTKEMLGDGFVQSMEHGGVGNTAGFMSSLGLPNPTAAAWVLTLTEFFGGLALIVGFKTRPIAAGLAFSQAVALNTVHKEDSFVGKTEFNVTLIGAAAALALGGPGKISLDG